MGVGRGRSDAEGKGRGREEGMQEGEQGREEGMTDTARAEPGRREESGRESSMSSVTVSMDVDRVREERLSEIG